MAKKTLDELLGGEKQFGRLRILSEAAPRTQGKSKIRFATWICDCGNSKEIAIGAVKRGIAKSCGCLVAEHNRSIAVLGGDATRTHGLSKTRTYQSWSHMRSRCLNKSAANYSRYGGRGITICLEWKDDFSQFLLDMGDRPESKTLDRINPDGNYEPDNCRWATVKEQQNNRRNSAS